MSNSLMNGSIFKVSSNALQVMHMAQMFNNCAVVKNNLLLLIHYMCNITVKKNYLFYLNKYSQK